MIKRKFDITEFSSQHVMHCRTLGDAIIFLGILNELGLTWCNGQSYLNIHNYETYNSDTCYRFLNGHFGDYDFYSSHEAYTVLEFGDFDWSDYDKSFNEEQVLLDFISGFVVDI